LTLKTILAISALAAVSAAHGQSFFVSTDRLAYAGTVTVHNTLANAQSGVNARGGVYNVSQRDAHLYLVKNRPEENRDMNILMTAWYYTTAENTNGPPKDDPRGDNYYWGVGNPSNTKDSFLQLYDDNGDSDISVSAGWTNAAHDTFSLNMSGGPGVSGDYGLFWNAGGELGSYDTLIGDYLTWNLQVTASGLYGTDLDGDGFIQSSNQPSSITGSFTGIFQNRNTVNPTANGFYRFNLAINSENWAFAQGDAALNGNFHGSVFGASPVPEPATLLALALGAGALAARRRKAK
jgi:hypothetical protein